METVKLRFLVKYEEPLCLYWTKSEISPGKYARYWKVMSYYMELDNNGLAEALFRITRILTFKNISAYVVEEKDGNRIHFFNFEEALQAFLNRTVGR